MSTKDRDLEVEITWRFRLTPQRRQALGRAINLEGLLGGVLQPGNQVRAFKGLVVNVASTGEDERDFIKAVVK